MKILITGATGFVGKELGRTLFHGGHEIIVLSRSPEDALNRLPFPCQAFAWDPVKDQIPSEAFEGVEVVIHLAGESIASGRWTKTRKKHIEESRVLATQNLVKKIRTLKNFTLKKFVSASAIGYYGDRADEWLTENSRPGTGFLSEVCTSWENAATQDMPSDIDSAQIRIGIVLGREGGMLGKILPLFSAGLGGPLATGSQWMSWIHLQDLIRIFKFVAETPKVIGPLNAVAPEAVTNKQFTKSLGQALKRPALLPAPAFALKTALGEMSTLLLGSQRVRPEALEKLKFEFRYPGLEEALKQIVHRDGEAFLTEQWIPAKVEEVFSFFSQAENLEALTPPWLNFHVHQMSTSVMNQGTKIDYRLKIHGVPVKWQSLISDWIPNQLFVDQQIKGPYAEWHHTHSFKAFRGGTLMKDDIRYRLPFGFLGKMLGSVFVRRDIEKIFMYRRQKVRGIFLNPS